MTFRLNSTYAYITLFKLDPLCERKTCVFQTYRQFEDWNYYSRTEGKCPECQERCDTDENCGAVECGKNYCAWWKKGVCTRSEATYTVSGNFWSLNGSIQPSLEPSTLYTCWKGNYKLLWVKYLEKDSIIAFHLKLVIRMYFFYVFHAIKIRY